MEQTPCAYYKCTNLVVQTPHKRKRLYCSDACRKAAERLRAEGAQRHREWLAEQKLQQVWATLPESVVTRLKQLQRTYGVWAALEATQAVLDYQNYQTLTLLSHVNISTSQ